MIAIVNMGPYDDPDPWGWRDYELRINKDVIATFRHKRCEGLPMCLCKAMEAAKAVELEDVFGMDRIAGEKKRSKKRMSYQMLGEDAHKALSNITKKNSSR